MHYLVASEMRTYKSIDKANAHIFWAAVFKSELNKRLEKKFIVACDVFQSRRHIRRWQRKYISISTKHRLFSCAPRGVPVTTWRKNAELEVFFARRVRS